MKRVCIVGVGESDCGAVPDKTALQLQQQATAAALAQAGLRPSDVDGLFGAGSTPVAVLAEYLGLRPRYTDGTQVGGATAVFFVQHAAAAIRAGHCEVALLVHGGTPRSDVAHRLRPSATLPAPHGPGQFEAPFGLTLVGKYAMTARRHMHEYGMTSRQLASVAVAAHQWAQRNPRAFHHGKQLSLEEALETRMVAEPLRAADCGLRTDGAGAVILITAERARDLRTIPISVLGTGASHAHSDVMQWDDVSTAGVRDAAAAAFGAAGVQAADIDVMQLDDAFTILVMLSLEAIGICRPGESGALVESGALAPGGRLPTNTDGGALAANQPDTHGIFALIEATQQLRHECGSRQVANARLALVNGIGGHLSASGAIVLGR
jgi:acetyl-CoA acetyltransferase